MLDGVWLHYAHFAMQWYIDGAKLSYKRCLCVYVFLYMRQVILNHNIIAIWFRNIIDNFPPHIYSTNMRFESYIITILCGYIHCNLILWPILGRSGRAAVPQSRSACMQQFPYRPPLTETKSTFRLISARKGWFAAKWAAGLPHGGPDKFTPYRLAT